MLSVTKTVISRNKLIQMQIRCVSITNTLETAPTMSLKDFFKFLTVLLLKHLHGGKGKVSHMFARRNKKTKVQ